VRRLLVVAFLVAVGAGVLYALRRPQGSFQEVVEVSGTMDEPTTGVAPVSRRQLSRTRYDLNRQGITLILTTPYVDEAERASRVGRLHGGRLVACDDPRRLRAALPGVVVEVPSHTP